MALRNKYVCVYTNDYPDDAVRWITECDRFEISWIQLISWLKIEIIYFLMAFSAVIEIDYSLLVLLALII